MKSVPRDIRHYLISELHRLLSVASSEDFSASMEICRSENLKLALECLAEEARSALGSGDIGKESEPKPVAGTRARKSGSSKDQWNFNVDQIKQILADPVDFPTRRELVELANRLNLKISSDPKQGRQRLIDKIAQQLSNLPQDLLKKTFSNNSLRKNSSQTEGWLDVIMNRNP